MTDSLVVRKKASIFKKWIDAIKLSKGNKDAQEIISSLSKHPKFSVYKSEYVKFAAHLLLEKNPDMCKEGSDFCVFFADGDNLRVANEIAIKKAEEINSLNKQNGSLSKPITGEELVDKDIESVLLQLKDITQQYGYEDALIGIQGDEIFIAIPNIKPEDKEKIYESYSKAKSGLVSISMRLL